MRQATANCDDLLEGEQETSVCRKCRQTKATTEFYFTSYTSKKLGRRTRMTQCIPCHLESQRDYLDAEPERRKDQTARTAAWKQRQLEEDPDGFKQRRRQAYLWNTYRLTVEQWDEMIIEQSGRCWTCEDPMPIPCVDHDHNTKEVRGLLCPDCNRGLGAFRDSPAAMLRAIQYLTSPRPRREGVAASEVMPS